METARFNDSRYCLLLSNINGNEFAGTTHCVIG